VPRAAVPNVPCAEERSTKNEECTPSPGHAQLLLACEWRDTYVETSVGYGTHRTSGTSNDASDIRLMPLTGSKNRFSAPNGS
jgi:hypothetical protein